RRPRSLQDLVRAPRLERPARRRIGRANRRARARRDPEHPRPPRRGQRAGGLAQGDPARPSLLHPRRRSRRVPPPRRSEGLRPLDRRLEEGRPDAHPHGRRQPPAARIARRRRHVKRLGLVSLVAATYFMVSGGPYGLEELLASSGYRRALVILV